MFLKQVFWYWVVFKDESNTKIRPHVKQIVEWRFILVMPSSKGVIQCLKCKKNVLKWNDVKGQEHKCDKLKTKKPNSNQKKCPFLQKKF